MISDIDVIIRLLLIALLSGLIGIEREYHSRPAGMRTNVMVGIGSTLMTLASIQTFALFPTAQNADPARISAQLVVGIGFIGAGVILRRGGRQVVGLTTAATMWVVCGLGIAVGMGLYTEALVASALVFVTLFLLTPIVMKIRSIAPKKYAVLAEPKDDNDDDDDKGDEEEDD